MNNPIIEVKNVFKGYKVTPNDVLILKDVTVQIIKVNLLLSLVLLVVENRHY